MIGGGQIFAVGKKDSKKLREVWHGQRVSQSAPRLPSLLDLRVPPLLRTSKPLLPILSICAMAAVCSTSLLILWVSRPTLVGLAFQYVSFWQPAWYRGPACGGLSRVPRGSLLGIGSSPHLQFGPWDFHGALLRHSVVLLLFAPGLVWPSRGRSSCVRLLHFFPKSPVPSICLYMCCLLGLGVVCVLPYVCNCLRHKLCSQRWPP